MAQPVPPPPPAKGFSLLTWLLLAAFAIAVLGYFQGWFEFKKNAETGKNELVVHKEKFSKDKDAFLKKSGEYAKSAKDKIASMMKSKETAKPEDKAAIEKQIADLKQQLEKLEGSLKDADKLSDEAALKKATEGADEIKKLLDNPK
jgi:polyhydroxyalkanoate synthesis regulator phasin